jgi:hypothetical protein
MLLIPHAILYLGHIDSEPFDLLMNCNWIVRCCLAVAESCSLGQAYLKLVELRAKDFNSIEAAEVANQSLDFNWSCLCSQDWD